MKKLNSVKLSLGLAALFSATLLLAEPVRASDVTNSSTVRVPAPVPVYAKAETAEFKSLAKKSIAALDAGRNTDMVAKLTDLETAWDVKEDVLKPKDAALWTLLDKTLDKAISALRSSKTNLPKGRAALEDFMKLLEKSTKQ